MHKAIQNTAPADFRALETAYVETDKLSRSLSAQWAGLSTEEKEAHRDTLFRDVNDLDASSARLANEIYATPAQNMGDVLVKVRLLHRQFGGHDDGIDFPTAQVLSDIERLATSRTMESLKSCADSFPGLPPKRPGA